ncbi:MAG: prephenate dehydrogenase/arogenate dehydrogenase family protein [Chloroflexota bacterium]
MAIRITIVGLGQIGTSIGLALADHQELLFRVGHDRELQVARQAEKMGALDRVEINLPKAVRDSELVLLSLPIDQIRETMEIVAPDLKEGAVVMDTGPIKEAVAAWAGELLPQGRHYVGLTPVINPAYLHDVISGVEAARPDLFRRGMMAIVAPPRANSDAIKLAADLTRLLGAMSFFADPAEIDGLMAATHTLPQVMAAGLLNATVDQPGWREGRKVAGRAYAEVSGAITHLSDPNALTASILINQQNVKRVLDGAIAALQAIRGDIEAGDEAALQERLGRARRARELWWHARQAADWANEDVPPVSVPENPGILGRLFGTSNRPRPRDKK